MRRALVAQDHTAIAVGLPRRLALDQQVNARAQPVKLAILPRNHVREVLKRARQMRHLLFKLCHGPDLATERGPVNHAAALLRRGPWAMPRDDKAR